VCRVCRGLQKSQRMGRVRTPGRLSAWLRAAMPTLAAILERRLFSAELTEELLADAVPEHMTREEAAPAELELISAEAWQRAMRLICSGVTTSVALKQCGIRRFLFDAHLRHEPKLAKRYAAAKAAGKRKNWPEELIDKVLREISDGASAAQALRKHKPGLTDTERKSFHALTQRDKALEQRYLFAAEWRRDRAFEDMRSELDEIGDGITRGTKREMNRRIHALRKLEPRRLRARKPVSERHQRLREARARARRAGSRP
jgi:hypothetical protein